MQIFISGVDKSSLYVVNSLEIGDEINARSTCRFQLVDKTGAYHPPNGATVAIYDNAANLIFGGFIKEPDENVLWGTDALAVNVDCVDNQAICDWRLVAESYDNMTTGAIVKDIIDTTLREEGVWYSSALSFDGVDDYVNLGSPAILNITGDLTLEIWAYIPSPASGPALITWAHTGYTTLPYHFALLPTTGHLRFYDGVSAHDSANPVPSNQWVHLAVTVTATITTLYINGAIENSSASNVRSSGDSFLSISGSLGSVPLNGSVDDVRIWNVARTQAEIQADMNRELIGNESGLVGYWKLNEGSGLVAIDSTANGNNGTITGGATYTTGWLTDNIQDGITATRVVFPRIKASQAMDELAEMSGFTWWVDSDKKFYFVDRSTYLAPWNITATSPIRNVNYRRNEDQYRNKQYIRAGQDTTSPQVAIFKGDGEQKTFTVAYVIAVTPIIEVNLGGAGYVAKTVGIRGLETGKDWYWNKGEKEISQDSAGTALSATDLLRLPSYVGFFPILTVSEDASAIAERKAISGGTGIREDIEQQSNIDSSAAALEIAQGRLIKYARIAGELTFETDTIGLEVGQIITVTLPAHSIVGVEFLIDRITVSEPFADQALRYFIHCVDGQALGNWTTFFKKLAAQATTFGIRENEVLIKLKSAVDAVTVAESLNYTAAAPENRVGFATVGYSEAYQLYQLIWNDLDAQGLTWNALDALLFTWDEFEAWQP